MTASVYYADRDRRVKELNRARKSALLEIFRQVNDGVTPTDVLRKWRKDELCTEILRVEFPPVPPNGTPVTVRQNCTLPWLRGESGVIVGRSGDGTALKVLLKNRGHEKKLPLSFIPFELEVSR